MKRAKLLSVLAISLLFLGCNAKDPIVGPPGNNDENNENNMSNNGSNNGTTASNNANNMSNNANNGMDMGGGDMGGGDDMGGDTDMGDDTDMGGDDMGQPAAALPSSSAVTGGQLTGESDNYKVRLQVGAPHAAPKPKSDNYEAEVAPPSPR